MTMKEREKKGKRRKAKKCCAFTGVESTRERHLRAECAAATGEFRHLMARCTRCVHSATMWICLACWAAIASKTLTYEYL